MTRWADIRKLRAGDKVNVDGGFTCLEAGEVVVQQHSQYTGAAALYVSCRAGKHFLEGQCDDGIHCVGITMPVTLQAQSRRSAASRS